MMKKLLVGTVLCLALVIMPAFAGDDDKFTVTLDAWVADLGGLSFLGAQDITCPGPGGGCGRIPLGIMSLDDGGTIPAFEVSWNNGNGNGVAISFYDLDEDGPFTSLLSNDANVFSRLHEFNTFSEHGDWWEGMVGAEITNWAIEWTHVMNSSDSGAWQIAFGVTGVDYAQTDLQYMNNLHNFGNVITERIREYSVTIDSEFEGFGPSIAVSGNHNLGSSGLQFIGDVSLSVLVGDADVSYRSEEDPFDLSNTPHPTSGIFGDIDGDGTPDIIATMQDDVNFLYGRIPGRTVLQYAHAHDKRRPTDRRIE